MIRIWNYFSDNIAQAFESKNEINFDWYSDGREAFWCVMCEIPIKITPRVKPL